MEERAGIETADWNLREGGDEERRVRGGGWIDLADLKFNGGEHGEREVEGGAESESAD